MNKEEMKIKSLAIHFLLELLLYFNFFMKKITFLLLFVSFSSLFLSAQKELKLKSVAVFKDGNSFVIKSGTVKTDNGRFRLTDKDIPQARFGSLWMASPELKNMTSFWDTLSLEKDRLAVNDLDLLIANKGKTVTVTRHDKDNKPYDTECTIEEIVGENSTMYDENNYRANVYALVKSKEGKWFTIRDFKEFSFKPITTLKVPYKKPVSTLQLEFSTTKMEQTVDMMHLQKGLSWSPFYYMELLDDKKLKLTLRAEIINQTEKIDNTDLSLVVGLPNFKYAANLAGLVNFGNTARVYQQNDELQNISNYGGNVFRASDDTDGTPDNFNNQIEGQNVEDFYFYSLKNFSLSKGGRGHYQVFSHELNYEHVYEYTIQDGDANTQSYNNNTASSTKNGVFHSIKLHNNTPNPFTTAPVTIISNETVKNQPLGQDVLNFTSKKGISYVKITQASDVTVKNAEKVIKREETKAVFWGYAYYLSDLEGTVKIKNYKTKTIQLEINRSIKGILQKSEAKWETITQTLLDNTPNLNNQVCWKVELKPGEEKTFTYTYQVYNR
jgi:hypothetical protein